MNEELKFKMHSVYGQILFERKLEIAFKQVKANRGSGGIDNVTISDYQDNLDENLINLRDKLKAKEYKPTSVKRVYIPKKNGKLRPLGIPTIEDRIVQQAVVNVLNPKFETEIFHKWSCGYRRGLGAQRVLQIIMWNIETGYNHIYDCDIKGFFDNIPHKKLMKVLNKYVSDGTTLNLIWKWLKAGYMQDGIKYETNSGTPQGGVISPLLANIYLNELDWELEKEGIRFVRYADDFLLFAKSKEDIERASEIAKKVITDLGLEIAVDKTKTIDFNDDDFDFIGYTFKHWTKTRHGRQYTVIPSKSSIKDFKIKIKDKTRKSLTFSKEVWFERVNPIIRGKVNYYLNIFKAIVANSEYGLKSRCNFKLIGYILKDIDTFIRRRLRVCMIHRNPKQRKGMAMNTKWNNAFFFKSGLISAHWLLNNKLWGCTIEQYLDKLKTKSKAKLEQQIRKAKEQGKEYYTKERLATIRLVKTF